MNKHNRLIPALAMIACALLCCAARAEVVNTTAELPHSKKTFAYLYSRPQLEALYRLGVEQDKKFGLQPQCKSTYQVKPFATLVLSPINFPDDAQQPDKGLWLTRYQLERCGESKFYNVAFTASEHGQAPSAEPYYPGASLASPRLVKDAMLPALSGALAQAGLKDCKNVNVFDMQVTDAAHDVVDGDKTHRGVWNETWTFKACGQTLDVAMTFVPDATGGGTSFVAKAISPGALPATH